MQRNYISLKIDARLPCEREARSTPSNGTASLQLFLQSSQECLQIAIAIKKGSLGNLHNQSRIVIAHWNQKFQGKLGVMKPSNFSACSWCTLQLLKAAPCQPTSFGIRGAHAH